MGYTVGIAASVALAGQLFANRLKLSHALAGLLLGWALNGVLLLSLLLYQVTTGGDRPGWREAALTLNAVVVGVAPVALWLALNRWGNGR